MHEHEGQVQVHKQITRAHATTDILYLSDTPASVEKCRITSQANLYWPLLTSIVVNDVRATTNPCIFILNVSATP